MSVENSDGSWEVFVKVADLEERIPMALYSSGASRLVAIVLAITASKRGVVLIDELENGFYYKTLPEIWRVIQSIAASYNAQVFVSTHSNECLNAIGPLAHEHAGDFCLMNIEAAEDGSRVTLSTGDVMAAAIQSGFEVR
jgi:predicted ATPase